MNNKYAFVFAIPVIVLLLVFSSNQNESVLLEGETVFGENHAIKTLTPEKYTASQFTTTVDSHNAHAQNSYDKQDWDLSMLGVLDADAVSMNEIEVKEWVFGRDIRYGHAIDSEGDLFAHGGHLVSRIDVSEGTQTIWTLPESWKSPEGSFSTVSSSGLYYFLSYNTDEGFRDGKLTSLNPDTGVFTQWNAYPSTRHANSVSNDIYFEPDDPLYITESSQRNLGFYGIMKSSNYLFMNVHGASGIVDTELVLPSGDILSKRSNADAEATLGSNFLRVFNSDYQIRDSESGNYTARVSDMFQTAEITFEVTATDDQYSQYYLRSDRVLSETSTIFLQKLDPSTGNITNFISDFAKDNHTRLVSSDSSGSLYFITTPKSSDDLVGVMKFDPNTGDITYWSDISELDFSENKVAVSGEKIYWGNHVGRNILKLTTLDMQDNTLSEITVPYRCPSDISQITVDSSGTVYFDGCNYSNLYQFVPDTDTFTNFGYGADEYLKADSPDADSPDVIYWADYSRMGTMNFVQTTPLTISEAATISPTKIKITTETELFSTSSYSLHRSFSVSENSVSDVTLDANTILITVRDTIEYDETITISYNTEYIRGIGGKYLVPFIDRAVDNTIEMESETVQETEEQPTSTPDGTNTEN